MSVKTGSAEDTVLPSPRSANLAGSAGLTLSDAPSGSVSPHFARETRSLRRADALVAAGQTEKALAHLRRVTENVPVATRARLKMATLLKETKRMEEAILELRQATAEAPADPAPQEALAELAMEVGAWQEAIRSAQRLLELSPRSLLARDVLSAAYLQRGMLPQALKMAQELCRLDPEDPVHHFKRGVLLQQMGLVSGATEAYLRVLAHLDGEEDEEFVAETREALEILDRYQLRQIAILAVEDTVFRARLQRNPVDAATTKGFRLSPAGMNALSRITLDDLPSPPMWRHRHYH